MTTQKEITCIVCPIGCKILVTSQGKTSFVDSGFRCKQGKDYALAEALDPRRRLTTSVLVKNGEWPLVSVRSSQPIPKDKLFLVLEEIKKINVTAPVELGQILLKNVCNTNIDIVCTKTVKRKK